MKIVKINAMWCPSCLIMKKVWNEIVSEYPDLDILELDYDMDNDEVMKYNVSDILPVTIIFNNDGEELVRLVGEQKDTTIKEYIDKYE